MSQRITEQQTITQRMHLWAQPWPSYKPNPDDRAWDFHPQSFGPDFWQACSDEVYVGEVDVTFTVPGGVDLLDKTIATLEEQKTTIRAKAYRECEEIDERIQKLRLIEHQPEEVQS